RVFIAHAYIPEVDWCLITELSENEAFLLPNKLLQLIVFVGIIAIVVSFLMISWISKKITDPIEALRLGAKRIEEGDMSHKVGTRDKDEIGQLSRAFDLMTTAIRNSWLEVDEKVKEQTSSITHQKEKLETQQRAILNILEDVEKEKKVSENLATDLEKFRLAVESSGDLMVITDPDGIILYANDATERITKFKIKDVLGKKAGTSSLWGGNMSEKYYKKLWKVIKEKKKPFIGELKNKRKDGEEYDVDVQISPILNKEGGVEFFVSVERDITKAKDVDRMKTEFVSLASHQLRTPLSAINWYTEMLLTGDAGELNKIQAQYLKEVYNGNQRMVRLVESLLNVSRMELGTFVVEPEDLNLKEIIESALHELESKINEKKLIIKLVYDKKIPLIKADPKLLHIIFQNLLSNAVKYTPEKGKVKCTLKKDKKNILIEISDTGYGIPKNQEDKIFSKLFRADNVRVKNVEGNGLGLYLVKAIVEEAKGKIWFKSKENKGTTFFVVMPLSGMKKKTGTRRLS
ncbi:MAG: cell wall metabolism sensor histidine kinase WalK, partial [Nanoarchaeota archaeon]|nr:cell wall metabolism sensor histidine kinase WalK [Nanoarchaeota archaeon]